jgi:hypothetical protein
MVAWHRTQIQWMQPVSTLQRLNFFENSSGNYKSSHHAPLYSQEYPTVLTKDQMYFGIGGVGDRDSGGGCPPPYRHTRCRRVWIKQVLLGDLVGLCHSTECIGHEHLAARTGGRSMGAIEEAVATSPAPKPNGYSIGAGCPRSSSPGNKADRWHNVRSPPARQMAARWGVYWSMM